MKFVLILLIVFTSFFVSCDGRINQHEALSNAVSEFNNNQTQVELITYSPKEYTEIVTDTVIEKAVRVHIKNYTLMQNNVIINFKDNPRTLDYQRSFESEISVYYPSGAEFKTLINAKSFKDRDRDLFWNNATLQHAWVNQEESNCEKISIMVSFVDPKTKSYKLYQMMIDQTGNCNILLKENYI